MFEGRVEVVENTNNYGSCNCCTVDVDNEKLWEVRFVFGSRTTVVMLCKKHLKELNSQANGVL